MNKLIKIKGFTIYETLYALLKSEIRINHLKSAPFKVLIHAILVKQLNFIIFFTKKNNNNTVVYFMSKHR